MNLKQWLNCATTAQRTELKEKTGINTFVLSQLKKGTRRPGIERSKLIAEVSEEITPNTPMTLHELRPDIWEAPVEQQ